MIYVRYLAVFHERDDKSRIYISLHLATKQRSGGVQERANTLFLKTLFLYSTLCAFFSFFFDAYKLSFIIITRK